MQCLLFILIFLAQAPAEISEELLIDLESQLTLHV